MYRLFFYGAVLLSLVLPGGAVASEKIALSINSAELKVFDEAVKIIKNEYVKNVPEKKLVENAINGMLSSLDPHSSYINNSLLEDMQLYTTGEFGGVGLELTVDNGMIKVLAPIDGSPAYDAGIKPGDLIISIDEESLYGVSAQEAIKRIRGRPGTKIKLSILRDIDSAPLDIELKRRLIKLESVSSKLLQEKFLYIRIASFAENTSSQVESVLKRYMRSNKKIPRGIIIDVRNNPGGLLDQAINVANIFLEKGNVVYTQGRTKESTDYFAVKPGGFKVLNIPVVMVINSGSASGAEILAGALQDHKKAVLLGTRSFGKGSVQEIIPLGEGAISLTTALYYTPLGRSIQAEGVEPDIIVEDTEMIFQKKENGYNAREENLQGHIESRQPSKKLDFEKLKQTLKESKKMGLDVEKDYQLVRALDLLKGISLVYYDKAN